MNATESKALIDKAGGDTAFARHLGIDTGLYWRQRVNRWRSRGIPAAVCLEYYDVLKRLQRKREARAK